MGPPRQPIGCPPSPLILQRADHNIRTDSICDGKVLRAPTCSLYPRRRRGPSALVADDSITPSTRLLSFHKEDGLTWR